MLFETCVMVCQLWIRRFVYVSAYIDFSLADLFPAYNVFTDFFCASLPAFVIKDLQMNTRTKYALSVLMGLGIL